MPEKPPAFVVTDRRKFTADGGIREGYTPPEERTDPAQTPAQAFTAGAATHEPAPATPANVVTMPGRSNRSTVEADEPGLAAFTDIANTPGYDVDRDGVSSDLEAPDPDRPGELAGPSAAEAAAQRSAYQQSAREMDALLQQANPGMQAPGAVGFEHIVQSFYLSAMMAMGAGTEPNQKPRIDLLGARQAIDMLAILEEKTRGNLNEQEQQLLQGVSFELRMMFLELINAIAAQAQQPQAGGTQAGSARHQSVPGRNPVPPGRR